MKCMTVKNIEKHFPLFYQHSIQNMEHPKLKTTWRITETQEQGIILNWGWGGAISQPMLFYFMGQAVSQGHGVGDSKVLSVGTHR
jgi:hypothetical protein